MNSVPRRLSGPYLTWWRDPATLSDVYEWRGLTVTVTDNELIESSFPATVAARRVCPLIHMSMPGHE